MSFNEEHKLPATPTTLPDVPLKKKMAAAERQKKNKEASLMGYFLHMVSITLCVCIYEQKAAKESIWISSKLASLHAPLRS